MDRNQPPVVRLAPDEARPLAPDRWPATIPAVAEVLAHGLDLAPGVTFLVGENGTGKSTLVEAVALAYGMSPEGGTVHGHHSTRPTESPLHEAIVLQRGIGTSRWGFFLRAETMHGWYTYIEQLGGPARFHEMSHGESFLEILATRFDGPGLYCLDEPEAALSFGSTLTLVQTLHDRAAEGAQVLCATHSPVLAALPGATILEVGPWGLRRAEWEDLELVAHWRGYLDDPHRYLRHLLA